MNVIYIYSITNFDLHFLLLPTFSVQLNAETLKRNRALTEDFTKLYLELEREGLFKPSYVHNILRIAELFAIAFVGYLLLQSKYYFVQFIGIFLLGLMQGRSGWIQHESGHLSLSGNPKFDRFFHAIIFGKSFI